MAVSPFEHFCLGHSCATWCADRPNYCPLADKIRSEHGSIDGRHCEAAWEEMMGIKQPAAATATVAAGFKPRRKR